MLNLTLQQLLNQIAKPVYAVSSAVEAPGSFNIGRAGEGYIPHASAGNSQTYQNNFWSWVSSLISIAMPIAALLVLAYLIWGAFEWITSEGDSGKLTKARQKITSAIIGIIILSATMAIFLMLQQFLGICVFRYGGSKYSAFSCAP